MKYSVMIPAFFLYVCCSNDVSMSDASSSRYASSVDESIDQNNGEQSYPEQNFEKTQFSDKKDLSQETKIDEGFTEQVNSIKNNSIVGGGQNQQVELPYHSVVGSASQPPLLYSQSFKVRATDALQEKVNVAFLLDSSSSMNDENEAVAESLGAFVNQLKTKVSNAKIFVVGDNLSISLPDVPVIKFAVNSTNALTAAYFLLMGYEKDGQKLDLSATNHLIVVSDDDAGSYGVCKSALKSPSLAGLGSACGPQESFVKGIDEVAKVEGAIFSSLTTEKYHQYIAAPLGYGQTGFSKLIQRDAPLQKFVLHGAVAKSLTTRANCRPTRVGSAYINLAGETGGHIADLCDGNWSQFYDKIVQNISLKHVVTQFELTTETTKEKIRVSVNDELVDGFSVDGRRLFINKSLLKEGDDVRVFVYMSPLISD